MKLIIVIPTRQRKEKFFQTLRQAQENIVLPDTHIHVTLDSDDYVMNQDAVKKVLGMYGNVTYTYGLSKNKIDAVNRDAGAVWTDYDVLLLLSDDMVPVVKGFDKVIIDRMQGHFPDTDGALWFNDGNEDGNPPTKDLNTLVCLGRKYYDRFGYLYFPEYKSFFCDNEYTEVGKSLGRLLHLPEIIIEHRHPLFQSGKKWGAKNDVLYMKNNRHWADDEALYFRRRASGFGIGVSSFVEKIEQAAKEVKEIIFPTKVSPLLSILIPTVVGREERFNELRTYIQHQIDFNQLHHNVEVLYIRDNKEMTLGEKRNKLFSISNGVYSVMIDDDDWIHHDYIRRVVDAAKEGKDCIGYKELCIWSGKKVQSSVFSLRYPEWKESFDGYDYVRSPFYKMPIKTDICKAVEFKSIRFGEDHDWSKRIFPLLHSEVFIDEFMYIYRHTQEDHNTKYGIR